MSEQRGIITRVATGLRYIVSGTAPADWFGPAQPLPPMAPPEVAGRSFDFPVGVNLRTAPRTDESIGFRELRALADAYDLLRLVIETRKDQVGRFDWTIRKRGGGKAPKDDPAIATVTSLLRYPDREHPFDIWLRLLLEDLLVIDAPALYVRREAGGGVYALEVVDGATVKRVLDARGRTPAPPDPAYQQILKGLPAVDYTTEELLYRPRNPRPHKIYGYSPVEQVVMTVNVALRRQAAQLAYYTEGNVPEAMIGVPESWNPDQIRRFQEYWDSLLEGNLGARRHAKFVPGGMKPTFTREPMLKDEYDEWLARVVCFAFSIAPTPFVRDANRATAETNQSAALSEGLAPLLRWIKGLLDEVIERHLGFPDLEFAWSEEDAEDPATAAQIATTYVGAGIKSVDEVRQELGLAPEGKGAAGVAKYSADQPRVPGGQPSGGQWASSDAAGATAHRTRLDEAPRFDVTHADDIATGAAMNVSYHPRGVEVAEGEEADAKPELNDAAKKAGIDETPPDYKSDRVTSDEWCNSDSRYNESARTEHFRFRGNGS